MRLGEKGQDVGMWSYEPGQFVKPQGTAGGRGVLGNGGAACTQAGRGEVGDNGAQDAVGAQLWGRRGCCVLTKGRRRVGRAS